jgi:hypothetical protein
MPGTRNLLARLVALRSIEVLTQAVVLFLAVGWLRIPLEVMAMSALIALLAAINLGTRWRLERGGPVTENEVFAHLAIRCRHSRAAALLCRGLGQPLRLFVPAATHAGRGHAAGQHAWGMAASR